MENKYFTLVMVAVLLLLPQASQAISGEGTTAATFYKIGVSPRAVAMGESYAAVSDDVTSIYWNPAGLGQLKYPEVTAMHVFWFEDIFYDHIAGEIPLDFGVAGISLIYLNGGTLLRSDEGDTPDDPDRGTFSTADVGFTAGYGIPFNESMYLGAGLKLFSETIDAAASFGWALDIGFLYHFPWQGITLGMVVQNLGPASSVAEEYFRLPINIKAGVAYRPMDALLLSMDYNQLLEQAGEISLGAEYTFEKIIAIRVGYGYQEKIDNDALYIDFGTNAAAGLSAGIGILYNNLKVDYAFVPYGFLGSTHRISLSYVFAPVITPTPMPTPTAAPTPIPTPKPQVRKKALAAKIKTIIRKIELGQFQQIQFTSGSSTLTAASLDTLNEIAAEMAKFPEVRIRIEGHTDSQGAKNSNLTLSQKRTDAVKVYLVEQQGLFEENLLAVGYGEARPVADNATRAGRQKNRRVEFVVLDIE